MNRITKMLQMLKKQKEIFTIIIAGIAISAVAIFAPAGAQAENEPDDRVISLQVKALQNSFKEAGSFNTSDLRPAKIERKITVTAYNSVPWQTDDTPCIGAQNTDICKFYELGMNTCAANFVPLGTVLEVEDLGTCVVRDRMNARYTNRVDWYMHMDISAARKFGVQQKNIGIHYTK
jgi:3D (Asp-Asp-Asp) domain-containing protein